MILSPIEAAWRNAGRAPFTFILNLAALTLGMLCFLAAWGTSAYWSTSDQNFQNTDRIEVLTQQFTSEVLQTGPEPSTSSALAKYLLLDMPHVEMVARFSSTSVTGLRSDRGSVNLFGGRADPALFEIFDFEFVEGTAQSALNDPNSLVLTESAARRLFGDDEKLGKAVLIGEAPPLTVSGVIRGPNGLSHFGDREGAIQRFDYITKWPAPTAGDQDVWFSVDGFTYALLKNGQKQSAFRSQLNTTIERRIPESQKGLGIRFGSIGLDKLQSRALDLRIFQEGTGRLSVTGFLYGFGALILLISCLNYANLAIAQATRQAREVGMRKVLGAGRTEISLQSWIEGFILAGLAAIIAVALLVIVSPALKTFAGIDLGVAFTQTKMIGLVLCLAVPIVACLASAYPALYLSRITPSAALRASTIKGGSPVLRNILVGLQFLAASVLLILLFIVSAQNRYIAQKGQMTDACPIVMLTDPGTRAIGAPTLRTALAGKPGVSNVSALSFIPWTDRNTLSYFENSAASPQRLMTLRAAVGFDFCDVFGCRLQAGRSFDEARDDAKGASGFQIIIDTELAKAFGFSSADAAVGEVLFPPKEDGETQAKPYMIVGVTEPITLNFGAASGSPQGQIFILDQTWPTIPAVKLACEGTSEGVASISDTVKAIDSNTVLRTRFVGESFKSSFQIYNGIYLAFSVLSLMAFAIATLGLIGMASFIANRRRHEIGVRKTLGASTSSVVRMLLIDFSKPILIANLLAWPIAYFGAQIYLSGFRDTIALTPWPWVMGFLITLGLGAGAVASEAFRAARVSPTVVLRHD